MDIIEQREFIRKNLHKIDENLLGELYGRIVSFINEDDNFIGSNVRTGEKIKTSDYRNELKDRNIEVSSGKYLTHEDVKYRLMKWKK